MRKQTERESRERGQREAEGGERKKGRNRVWQRVRDREVERRSEILLIHRDRLRFRGNMVSIVTALLRMPLVGNKKKNATHRWYGTHTFTQTHAITQQAPTCIYTSCYTNKHTYALKIRSTHTQMHPPTQRSIPPIQLTTQHTSCRHFPAAHTDTQTNTDIF